MVTVMINNIRLCIDPSDLNEHILRRHFPLRTVKEIANRVSGSKFFKLLDCRRGFWQIKIAEKSQKYLTFSTPRGKYTCTRLPFGLSSAPEVFSQIISELLKNVENTEYSVDDILIHSSKK